jgi:hypothetical protein
MTGVPSIRRSQVRSAAGRWIGVAAVDLALHLGSPAWLVLPAPWHPGAASDVVRSLGPFLGTVAVAHLLLTLLGDYLLVLATVSLLVGSGLAVAGHRSPRLARLPLSLSLPGTRTLVAWVLGLATLSPPGPGDRVRRHCRRDSGYRARPDLDRATGGTPLHADGSPRPTDQGHPGARSFHGPCLATHRSGGPGTDTGTGTGTDIRSHPDRATG